MLSAKQNWLVEADSRPSPWVTGGSLVGLVAFLVSGLVPCIAYGGLFGAYLAAGILGEPIGEGWLPRVLIMATIYISVIVTAALFVVVGGVLGRVLGLVASSTLGQRKADPSTGLWLREVIGRPQVVSGGLVGLLLFLTVGIWPSLGVGGITGVLLASRLLERPLTDAWLDKGLALAGLLMVVGVAAAVFVAVGAAVGDALAPARRVAPKTAAGTEPAVAPVVHEQAPSAVPAPAAQGSKQTELARGPDAATDRRASFSGGLVGLTAFLIFGLLPALVTGGFAGAALANGILGERVGETILSRAIVLFGMGITVLGTGALCVVLGAAGAGILSVSVGRVRQLVRSMRREPQAASKH